MWHRKWNILWLLMMMMMMVLMSMELNAHEIECNDGILNFLETDVDCGGPNCKPCPDGMRCETPKDCINSECLRNKCIATTCFDKILNSDESDVDCGGVFCLPCDIGKNCNVDVDCSSGACDPDEGICIPLTCRDGIKNGDESDIDCGGSSCVRCSNGETCKQHADCQEICHPLLHVCTTDSCLNGVQDGNETEVDCGGDICPPCSSIIGQPSRCNDRVLNGLETDVDCGGSECVPCQAGKECDDSTDCASGACDQDLGICLDSKCFDGIRNGFESDVDCGGPFCSHCKAGDRCESDQDCAGGECDDMTNTCLQSFCSNGKRDLSFNETDVDCGGNLCSPCRVHLKCLVDSDCRDEHCSDISHTCLAASCSNGVLDRNETSVDCGGPSCDPCATRDTCHRASDCKSGYCAPYHAYVDEATTGDKHICMEATCGNGRLDQDETDVDCGGPECFPCDNGETCNDNNDCASRLCENGICFSNQCMNGIRDNNETDVDCGGPHCSPCQIASKCLKHSDCFDGACSDGVCRPLSCSNGVLDGNETSIDCGGPICRPCEAGADCFANSDCVSGKCNELVTRCMPESCSDGLLNGNETDIDCGGPLCEPCAAGMECDVATDCKSGMCDANLGTCLDPTCADGVKNGLETDIDCGGGQCSKCENRQECTSDMDCESEACCDIRFHCIPASCRNKMQDVYETDVDCGGSDCSPCDVGRHCVADVDCESDICENQQCLAETCQDGIRNGNETDIDCGGPSCLACTAGNQCVEDSDCLDAFCDSRSNRCLPFSCRNDIRDQDESDIDCGGEMCTPCSDGSACEINADCGSGFCDDNIGKCVPASCTDQVRNGDETDVDCGGLACPPCQNGDKCITGTDCESTLCDALVSKCVPETCNDGMLSEGETDVDCGGPVCGSCVDERKCDKNDDCLHGLCSLYKHVCMPSSCANHIMDGNETGVDCGGRLCEPCTLFHKCFHDSDCISGNCDTYHLRCIDKSCNDGILSVNETDVDCGGVLCGPCSNHQTCKVHTDCESGFCDQKRLKCYSKSCMNHIQDAAETDIDCGGGECPPCSSLLSICTRDIDCDKSKGLTCIDNQCVPEGLVERKLALLPSSCKDGQQNNDETDIDCGGSACLPCLETGASCVVSSDCANDMVCQAAQCVHSTCDDGILSGVETDVDCGGGFCARCAPGFRCTDDEDCTSMHCQNQICMTPSCDDNIRNQDESDVDCGGTCKPCDALATCNGDDDCLGDMKCHSSHALCVPLTCTNGIQDNLETDVDCGEGCTPCSVSQMCMKDSNCDKGLICSESSSMCVPEHCDNGMQDSTETDIDCGGQCDRCSLLATCLADLDCAQGLFCAEDNQCRPVTCRDGLQNEDESDVDCGGSKCSKCVEIGESSCFEDRDCSSNTCSSLSSRCLAPTCRNSFVDGEETDVDCGGPFCDPCAIGEKCSHNDDCGSKFCDPITLQCSSPFAEHEAVVDCNGRLVTNRDCTAGAFGYTSCLQHLMDEICDDGSFQSDSAIPMNFNCPEFECDRGNCRVCGMFNSSRLSDVPGIDIASLPSTEIMEQFTIMLSVVFNGWRRILFIANTWMSRLQLERIPELKYVKFSEFNTAEFSYDIFDRINYDLLVHPDLLCNPQLGCRLAQQGFSIDAFSNVMLAYYDFRNGRQNEVVLDSGNVAYHQQHFIEGMYLGGGVWSAKNPQTVRVLGGLRVARLIVVAAGGVLDLSQASEIYLEQAIIVLPEGKLILGGQTVLSGTSGSSIIAFGDVDVYGSSDVGILAQSAPLLDIAHVILLGKVSMMRNANLAHTPRSRITLFRTASSTIKGPAGIFCSRLSFASHCYFRNLGYMSVEGDFQINSVFVNDGYLEIHHGDFIAGDTQIHNGVIIVHPKASWHISDNTEITASAPLGSLSSLEAILMNNQDGLKSKRPVEFSESRMSMVILGRLTLLGSSELRITQSNVLFAGPCALRAEADTQLRLRSDSKLFMVPASENSCNDQMPNFSCKIHASESSKMHIVNAIGQVTFNASVSMETDSRVILHELVQTARRRLSGVSKTVITYNADYHSSDTVTIPATESWVFNADCIITGSLQILGDVTFHSYSLITGIVSMDDVSELSVSSTGRLMIAFSGSGMNLPGSITNFGDIYVTGNLETSGSFINTGSLYIGAGSVGAQITELFEAILVPGSVSSATCTDDSPNVFVDIEFVIESLVVTLPWKMCSSNTISDVKAKLIALENTVFQDAILAYQGNEDLLSDSTELSTLVSGGVVSLTLELEDIQDPHGALEFMEEPAVGLHSSGGVLTLGGTVSSDGAITVGTDGALYIDASDAQLRGLVTAQGSLEVKSAANVEFIGDLLVTSNTTFGGNSSISSNATFMGDVEVLGELHIRRSAVFEGFLENRGLILLAEEADMEVHDIAIMEPESFFVSDGQLFLEPGSTTSLLGDFNIGEAGAINTNGAIVEFLNTAIVTIEGTITATGKSMITVDHEANVVLWSDVTLDEGSELIVESTSRVYIRGYVALFGNPSSLTGVAASEIKNRGEIIVTGTLKLDGGSYYGSGQMQVTEHGALLCSGIQSEALFDGALELSINAHLSIAGGCSASASSTSTIDGTVSVSTDSEFIFVAGSTSRLLSNARFSSSGKMTIDSRASVDVAGTFSSDGSTQNDGELSFSGSSVLSGSAKDTSALTISGTTHVTTNSKFDSLYILEEGTLIIAEDVHVTVENQLMHHGKIVLERGSILSLQCEIGQCTSFPSSKLLGGGSVVLLESAEWTTQGVVDLIPRDENAGLNLTHQNTMMIVEGTVEVKVPVYSHGSIMVMETGSLEVADLSALGPVHVYGTFRQRHGTALFEEAFVSHEKSTVITGGHVDVFGRMDWAGNSTIGTYSSLSIWYPNCSIGGMLLLRGRMDLGEGSTVTFINIMESDTQSTIMNRGRIYFNGQTTLGGMYESTHHTQISEKATFSLYGTMKIAEGKLINAIQNDRMTIAQGGSLKVESEMFSPGSIMVTGALEIGVAGSGNVGGFMYSTQWSAISCYGTLHLKGHFNLEGQVKNYGSILVSTPTVRSTFSELTQYEGSSLLIQDESEVVIDGTFDNNGEVSVVPGSSLVYA